MDEANEQAMKLAEKRNTGMVYVHINIPNVLMMLKKFYITETQKRTKLAMLDCNFGQRENYSKMNYFFILKFTDERVTRTTY